MLTIASDPRTRDARRFRIREALVIAAVIGMVATEARPSFADMERWDSLLLSANIPIRTIAVDPTDPMIIYAGISNGAIAFDPGAGVPAEGAGIMKSIDGGTSWAEVNLGLADLHVVAIAIDPTSPSTVYAATDGGGVFKSTTGGAVWVASSGGLPEEGEIYAFAMDPLSPSTLYAGTEHDGVFKSTNGAASWSAVNTGLDGSAQSLEIWALVVDPQDPSNVYAGTRNGAFRSANGAGTWTPLGPLHWINLNDGSSHFSSWVYALAIDPASPQTVYAGVLDAGGVFRSDNSGSTWTNKSAGLDYYAGYSYITALAIDPHDPSTLFAGTQDRGVLRTTDGGARWVPLETGLGRPGAYAVAYDSQDPARAYTGTSLGGVYRLGSDPITLDHYRCFAAKGQRVQVPSVTLVDDLETRTTTVGRPTSFCEPVSLSGSAVIDPTTYLTCYRIYRGGFVTPSLVGLDHQLSLTIARDLKPTTLCVPTEKQGTPSALNLNHFKSYGVRKYRATLFAITLDGNVGSQDAKFFRQSSILTPVDVDGSGVVDLNAHLACLELRYRERGFEIPEPTFARQTVTIDNEFGVQTIELIEPRALCLASSRAFLLP